MMLRTAFLSLFILLASATVAWADKPDLAVTDISLDGDCFAVVTVRNQGAAISDEDFENAKVMQSVAAQTWSSDLTQFDPQGLLQQPGGILTKRVGAKAVTSGRVRVDVDYVGSAGAIAELSESNNALSKNLTCPSYDPDQYKEVIVNIESWRLLDDCSVEAVFINEGPGPIDPAAYSRQAAGGSANPIIASVSWAGVSRTNVYLGDLDPSKKLQPQGGKLTYVFPTATLGNKVFKGTEVSVRTYTLRSATHRYRTNKRRVWCFPNLVIDEIKQKPTQMLARQRGWLKAKVTNKGDIASKATTLQFRVGGESTPSDSPVPALGPGKSHYVNREMSFDRMGSYTVTATVDPKKQVAESKENDNVTKHRLSVEAPPGKADLVVSKLSLDDKCRVVVELENKGPGWLPMKVYDKRIKNNIDLFIFRDGKGWGGAALHTFDRMRELQPPGGKVSYTARLRVGKSNKIRAIVDQVGRLHEANEQNNALNRELECLPKIPAPIRPIKAKPLRPAPRPRPEPRR